MLHRIQDNLLSLYIDHLLDSKLALSSCKLIQGINNKIFILQLVQSKVKIYQYTFSTRCNSILNRNNSSNAMLWFLWVEILICLIVMIFLWGRCSNHVYAVQCYSRKLSNKYVCVVVFGITLLYDSTKYTLIEEEYCVNVFLFWTQQQYHPQH